MKNYKEIADSVFERSDSILRAKAKRRRDILRIGSVVVPCFIIVALALNIWTGEFFKKQGDMVLNNPPSKNEQLGCPSGDCNESDYDCKYEANISDGHLDISAGIGKPPFHNGCIADDGTSEDVETESADYAQEPDNSEGDIFEQLPPKEESYSPEVESNDTLPEDNDPIWDTSDTVDMSADIGWEISVEDGSQEDSPPSENPPDESSEDRPGIPPLVLNFDSLQPLRELYSLLPLSDEEAASYLRIYGDKGLHTKTAVKELFDAIGDINVIGISADFGYELCYFSYYSYEKYISLAYTNGNHKIILYCYFDGYEGLKLPITPTAYAIVDGERLDIDTDGRAYYDKDGAFIELNITDISFAHPTVLTKGLYICTLLDLLGE